MDEITQYLDLDPVPLPDGTVFRLPGGRCLIAQPSELDNGWIVLEYDLDMPPHVLIPHLFPSEAAAVSYAHVAHALRVVEMGWQS